ncbi:hypothetical protein GE21DRAFT_10588 [Neurospora crassa]|uniref:DUF3176 domain-containing protein n=1 Tax=Neurospora crassa (strain ATCC 24698 / 74-OR23-1A / CBS 708.71 / DSM 1257 / FGSC 987) TaxID=367110 RepID=Q7S4H8_NEUCR|nr:hypothetical protein NCU08172 [Neurospora crassa OR74A]EAA30428.2 hypothetical protein NCU08172 [Neurospora crassa OR74A]KHE80449.1 hypothetical protein GE21DRAFT_10588 [Neurospora crassa]|eukprot:XP_959664.2 hypothetical protein NCU08172 [Neurospora crassa OR74A]
MTLSCFSLALTLSILYFFDGKPLESWPLYLSLGTIISTMAQISRTSLAFAITPCLGQAKWNWFSQREDDILVFRTFDEASRGPLGSLQLLWKLKYRHLASLGALVTVVMFGYDPFVQAIVNTSGYEVQLMESSRAEIRASIKICVGEEQTTGRQITLKNKNGSMGPDMVVFQESALTADYGLTLAVYDGFVNKSAALVDPYQPSFSCETGNCTFQNFDSLAVCSRCINVSDHIRKEQVPSGGSTYTRYLLPYDLEILNWDDAKPPRDKSSWGSLTVLTSISPNQTVVKVIANRSESISFANFTTTFVVFRIIQSTPEFVNDLSPWNTTFPLAMECGLSFCVNRYNSSVRKGILHESILDSRNEWLHPSLLPRDGFLERNISTKRQREEWMYPFNHTLSSPVRPDLHGTLWDFPRSDLLLATHPSLDPGDHDDPGATTVSNRLPYFNITQITLASTIDWFTHVLAPEPLIYPTTADIGYGNPVAGAIAKSTNLSITFNNVARSMTAWIREKEGIWVKESSTKKWEFRFCIRWPFVTVPVAVMVASALYLGLTIWQTRMYGVDPWKEDALAAIAHGLDQESKAKICQAERVGLRNEAAMGMRVMLRQGMYGEVELRDVGKEG